MREQTNGKQNVFKRLFRGRDAPERAPDIKDQISAAPEFDFGAAASGKNVTEETAIQISTVYACVRVLAETIASLPLNVYESDGKGGSRIAQNHPLEYLLHDAPNEEMTSFIWREQMMTQILLRGNSYSQIVRSGKTAILSIYPLLSSNMTVDRDDSGALTYKYQMADENTITLSPTARSH